MTDKDTIYNITLKINQAWYDLQDLMYITKDIALHNKMSNVRILLDKAVWEMDNIKEQMNSEGL